MKVNEIITDNFIKGLEQGNIIWDKPNQVIIPKNFAKKNVYTGINHIYLPLQMSMRAEKFKYPLFASMKQINELGGHVKHGSKAFMCIFFTMFEDKKNPKDSKGKDRKIPVLRYYNIFNIEQTDLPLEKFIDLVDVKDVPSIEETIERLQAKVFHDNTGENFYLPTKDEIHLTDKSLFKSTEHYYSTLLHELCHWTGHDSRLKRISPEETRAFGSSDYSKEELVAEIGSSFLMNFYGLMNDRIRENSQAYINNWIKVLKSNPNWIVSASARAQKAYDLILGIKVEQPTAE